ncbi:MAG: hypothetical protein WAN36_02360, partial [Calditrichia bacterium]
ALALANFTEVEMVSAGLFKNVGMDLYRAGAKYQISLSVYQIEYIDTGGEPQAHLSLKLSFMESLTRVTLVQRTFNKRVPLEKRDLNLFSVKISELLHQELSAFAGQIETWLRDNEEISE